ncbi:MAG: glycosyltransferase [Pyrinomonadaceae bacterium MAG19_C2-C3]|nr:glycosyltransferase [Pyrinomonadaceae bacterium MAG19_C2-C3]
MKSLTLDVVIPTYNRSDMLRRTLQSLLDAEMPPDLQVAVAVVDNNSKDATRETVHEFMSAFNGQLKYVFECEQGSSAALNAGIAATSSELVGMINDDEEVDKDWFNQIDRMFRTGDLDFIGGACLPRWEVVPPSWLPDGYRGVIGWVENGDELTPYDDNFNGVLMGGNCVVKRAVFERIGGYATSLGRTDKKLLSGEDEDFYLRLRADGARGIYVPGLIIYHFVPATRLTKKYYRSWCFWCAVSLAMLERERGKKQSLRYIFNVPRWMFKSATNGMITVAASRLMLKRDEAQAFSNELNVWYFTGFFYGANFYKPQITTQLPAESQSLTVATKIQSLDVK